MDKHHAALMGFGALGAAAVVSYAIATKKSPPHIIYAPPIPPEPFLPPIIPPTSENPLPDKTPFSFDRLQTATVGPNTMSTVYLGKIPQSYAAIVTDVGNTYPFALDANGIPLVTLKWMIDGDLIERVQRLIADINSPRRLNPPYLALNEIRWVCENRHPSQSALVTVLQDGFMQLRKDR